MTDANAENEEELFFCEECAFSAGTLLARIAELEEQALKYGRKASGIQARVIVLDRDAPATVREPSVTRKMAAACK